MTIASPDKLLELIASLSGGGLAQAEEWLAQAVSSRVLGVGDIRRYGAVESPEDIGPAVQAAGDAVIAAGGGSIFIPPRPNGQLWGWTTFASHSSLTNDRGLFLEGIRGATAIKVPLGGTSLYEMGTSNSKCGIHGLIFAGDTGAGVNVPNVVHIRQSRQAQMSDCIFYGIRANADGHGVARIIADGVDVERVDFIGCDYAGTQDLGGVFSITGERDNVNVKSCRFVSNDCAFRGVTYNKSGSTQNCWLWFGGQGLSGASNAYGEVNVQSCYFESTGIGIGFLPEVASSFIIQKARAVGCTFNQGTNYPSIKANYTKRLIVDGAHVANSSAGDTAILVGNADSVIVRDSVFGTGGKKIKFTAAVGYMEENECQGLTWDETSFAATKAIKKSLGATTVVH